MATPLVLYVAGILQCRASYPTIGQVRHIVAPAFEPASKETNMPQIWQLSANYRGVTATGTCNGFPVMKADTGESGESGFTTMPLNPVLIGKGNVLRIEVTQKSDDAEFNCSVEDAMTGDIIDTGNAAKIELPEGDPPHVIEIKFDSPQDLFAGLLAKAEPADEKSVVDYAIKLRDMLNGKDVDGLMKAFTPKFEDMSKAFEQPLEMMMQQARGMIEAFCSARHEFEAADVNAIPCCDNKLWELKNKEGEPLIQVKEEDGVMRMDACVARLPDGIAIVR